MNDGGPAFPRPASEYTQQGTLHDGNDAIPQQDGMSMLDYFAAKAMEAFIANSEMGKCAVDAGKKFDMDVYDSIAKAAYAYAKAMLKARKEAL